MKVKVKSVGERKLVAVIGSHGYGLFIRAPKSSPPTLGPSVYVSDTPSGESQTLENLLSRDPDRIPVYKGDTVEITF